MYKGCKWAKEITGSSFSYHWAPTCECLLTGLFYLSLQAGILDQGQFGGSRRLLLPHTADFLFSAASHYAPSLPG